MNNTPRGNRKHIVIYGKRNVGKSSIINSIVGQRVSLVSETKGTTTDIVSKAMELPPYGPVLFIDTGGVDDSGDLGNKRVKKTLETLNRADLAIYVISIEDIDTNYYKEYVNEFRKKQIPFITVINKVDLVSNDRLQIVKEHIKLNENIVNPIFVSTLEERSIDKLKDAIMERLGEEKEEESLIKGVIPYDGKVVMVIHIDSEAPKGRLILPQSQLIRDCLDNGIKSYIVRDKELASAIKDLEDIDLVVTDSQIFKEVDAILPPNIKLTSFSILMARQKGDLKVFVEGVKSIERLRQIDKPRILIMESCTHSISHKDIGSIKIPNMLTKYLNKEIDFQFQMGNEMPENIEDYDLLIHCGSCMLNKKIMMNRISICKEKGVPITNYGILLAQLTGILDKSIEIFEE